MKRANLVEELEEYGIIDRHEVFARYHNSIVRHFGVERTLNAMSLGGHSWAGMRQKLDWRVWHMPEDLVSTSTRLGRPSGASYLFFISTYSSSCRYAWSAERG